MINLNKRKKFGFTLIELVVSIGVIALLVAFSVPTYQLMVAQQQLNSAVDQVEEYIRLTQQKTVTEQQSYGLTFISNSTTVTQFLYVSDTEKTTVEVFNLPTNIKIKSTDFANQADIRFTSAGSPNISGSLVLNDIIRNRSKAIEIRPSGAIISSGQEF